MGFLDKNFNKMFLMLGSGCNFQCKYCMQHPIMTEELCNQINPDVIEFIKEISKEKILYIMLWGGEPLLYWSNIVSVVNQLKGSNVSYGMITNGSLLTKDKVDFINENNISLTISWDGANTNITRGRDVFQNQEIKENFFRVETNSAISSVNSALAYPKDIFDGVKALNEECAVFREKEGLTPKFISLNIDEIMDTGLEQKFLTDISMDKVYNQMTELCKMYEDMQSKGEYNNLLYNFMSKYINAIKINAVENKNYMMPYCGNGFTTLNVDLEGNLYSCHNTCNIVGTIYDSYFKYLPKVIESMVFVRPECNECPVQEICANGCPRMSDEVRKKYYCQLRTAMFYPVYELVLRMGSEANAK